jgi:uncharacterized protein
MVPDYLDIPIFPLPNVTFFSHTLMPLHVFEPRYDEMTKNCLAGDRLMGVALLREGWQKDYFGRPPIFRTFGIGKIIDHRKCGDGRCNLVLEGLYRARLIEEFPTRPYRTGRVEVLHEWSIDGVREQIGGLMREVRACTDAIARAFPDMREPIMGAWAAHPHPMVVINHLAAELVTDSYDRQSILEQDDPMRRIHLITIQLRAIMQQVQGRELSEEVIEEE